MIQIASRGQPTDELEVAALEGELGAKLPSDYRQFLIEKNGGKPVPNVVDVEGLPGSPTDVQVFFGIGRNTQSSELNWNLALVADRCPGRQLLPIACDSWGRAFLFERNRRRSF